MVVRPMGTKDLDRWYRASSDLNVWEDIASWFHTETGHLRPGKDKPIGFHDTEEGELDCCHESWLEWTSQKRSEAIAGLLAERARHISALKIIADPSTADMTFYGTTLALRAHAQNALQERDGHTNDPE